MAEKKPVPAKTRSIKELHGCIPLRRKEPVTVAEMNRAILDGAVERFERSKKS